MNDKEKELLLTAIEWLQKITQEDTFDVFLEKVLKFKEFNFDYSRVETLIKDYDESIKINFLTAYFLIYIFSGKYPDEIWDDNVSVIIDDYRFKSAEYQRYFDKLKLVTNDIKRRNNDELDSILCNIKGNFVNDFLKVSNYKNYGVIETLTYITIFKDKPGGYIDITPQKWLEILKNSLHIDAENINIRNNKFTQTKFYDLYALSVKGISHTKCDDCSNVVKLDDETWAAFCADGLGSKIMSHIGSELAGMGFIECISKKHNLFKKNKKYYTQNMMQYIQFELSNDIAQYWQENVENYIKEHQENNTINLEVFDFSSTLLVSFGCKDFIVCGMVGDGNLVIEKTPVTSLNEYGYLKMNDCFSNVVQKNVLNVSHLVDKPHIMQFRFFKPEEISSIILTSDGANAMFYKSYEEILYSNLQDLLNVKSIFEKLSQLECNICKEELLTLCMKFIQNNRFGGGKGDDCTIVYIKSRR